MALQPAGAETQLSPSTGVSPGQDDGPNRTFLRLDGLAHRFGTRLLFQDVSASLESGQTLIVSGRNGSGKSTLLRIVAGLLAPTSGRVELTLDGQPCDAAARRLAIGYVAPDLTLYKELTGVENLEFFARLRGRRLTHDELRDLLTTVGLLGRGRDLVGAYSSGMRQRLKYAFALLADPPLLLLDEPTANLDVDGMGMVERVLAAHVANGGLAVIATNEPREEAWGQTCIALG